MKTGNAILIMTVVILVALVGVVVAEDFMMPEDFEEDVNVVSSNNPDNASVEKVTVQKHVPPRGVFQKARVYIWNPWSNAIIQNNFVILNNIVYKPYQKMYTSVAVLNEQNEITNITVYDNSTLNELNETFNISDNATVLFTEKPSTSLSSSSSDANANNTTTGNDTEKTTTGNDTEKINSKINLKNQTLEKTTETNITGTLVDENGTAIAEAQITITINGETTTQTTDANGQFIYEYNNDSNLDVGNYTMDVSYEGNDTYNETSISVRITIENSEELENTSNDDSSSYDNEVNSEAYNYENSYASSESNDYYSNEDYGSSYSDEYAY